MKKKIVALLLTALIAVLAVPAFAACTPREDTLKILSWETYVDESYVGKKDNAFLDYYKDVTGKNLKIVYDTASDNELMLEKIAKGSDYDLVCPSEYMVQRMLKNELLIEFDKDLGKDAEGGKIEDFRANVSPFVYEKTDEIQILRDNKGYFVPYMWGTMGIMYNLDVLKDVYAPAAADGNGNGYPDLVESWKGLFVQDQTDAALKTAFGVKNHEKIYMKNSTRDSMAVAGVYAAAKAAGDAWVPTNSVTLKSALNVSGESINALKDLLIAQNPYVFEYEDESGRSDLEEGQGRALSLQWSGDAVNGKKSGIDSGKAKNVGYYVPDEGSNIWFDSWVMPIHAANKSAANLFVNFMCSPEAAIANMAEVGYTSAVATPEILAWIAEEYGSDGGAYPVSAAHDKNVDLTYFFGNIAGADSVEVDIIHYPTREIVSRCAIMVDYSQDDLAKINQAFAEAKKKQ